MKTYMTCYKCTAMGMVLAGIVASSIFRGTAQDSPPATAQKPGGAQNAGAFLFTAADIADVKTFADRLTRRSDPVSQYLWARMSESTQQLLMHRQPDPGALQGVLVQELNRVVRGEPIYQKDRFEDVKVSDEAKKLSQRDLKGLGLLGVNRALLQDAYSELGKSLTIVTDPKSERFAIIGLKGRMLSLCDAHGTGQWSVDVVAKITEPIVGDPRIRHVHFDDDLVVTVGKHTSVKVAAKDGAVTYLGTD